MTSETFNVSVKSIGMLEGDNFWASVASMVYVSGAISWAIRDAVVENSPLSSLKAAIRPVLLSSNRRRRNGLVPVGCDPADKSRVRWESFLVTRKV